jgi:hypothetical protein
MLIANIPAKFQEYWAQNAGGAYILIPPVAPNPTPGGASFDQGFPPANMTLGGIPPFGQYFNGIIQLETKWSQWFQAGGPIAYDSTFQSQISGYPLGARVGSTNVTGRYWTSTTDGNTTNPDTGGTGWLGSQDLVVPATGAQLQFTNTSLLTLAPKNGGLLWVNGFNYPVPASLTTSNSGLAPSTLYYIYAAVAGGFLTLDPPSTMGYAIASNGMPQKSGDVTRTCVGMCSTDSGGLFKNQDGFLWVRSYFQRQLVRSRTSFSADQTSSNGTLQELSSTIQNSFLVWAGENVEFAMTGSTSGATAVTAVSFDGGAAEIEAVVGNGAAGLGLSGVKVGLAEGKHYATLFGAAPSGATWRSSLSGTAGTAPSTITLGLGR